QPYPVGRVVRAWYRRDRPELVFVPDSGVVAGAVILNAGVGAVLFAFFAVWAVGLFRKAWTHQFVLRRTTGRVLRGEVRHRPTGAGRGHYYAVLFVQRGPASAAPMAIEWGKFAEKSAAAAELGRMLAAHPADQRTPVWFDPAGRYPPT